LTSNRLWESIVLASGIETETKWADLSKMQLQNLSNQLTNASFQVNGKVLLKKNLSSWRNRLKRNQFQNHGKQTA
jgi:predicted flavoprotein YhiN